jgi:hypothetical protein
MLTVIVGAGTNGLYLANILVSRGLDVVLLERGDDAFQFFPKNEVTSVGRFNNGVQYGRAIGIGGTTNLWGGQLVKFDSEDLELGHSKWPMEMKILDDYYNEVLENLDVKYLYNERLNTDFKCVYTSWLREPNFKKLFGTKLKSNIYTNVRDIDISFHEDKILDVNFYSNDEKIILNDVGNVVLAAGTIENVRIMEKLREMVNCPFRDNSNIGLYFQDHIDLTIGKIVNPTSHFLSQISTRIIGGHKFQPKYVINKSSQNVLGCSFIFNLDSDFSNHFNLFKSFIKNLINNNLKFRLNFKFFKSLFIVSRHIIPILYSYFVKNLVYIPKKNIIVRIQMEQLPLRESCIYSVDGRTVVNWKLSGEEQFCLLEYIKKFEYLVNEGNFGSFVINPDLSKGIFNFGDTYHHSGGTIMAKSSNDGVVDGDLLVHGTKNLYVLGGSILPSSSYANTGLTMLAFSHRLADKLCNKVSND